VILPPMHQPREGGVVRWGLSRFFSFFISLHVPNHKPEEEGQPFSSKSDIIYINYKLCWSGYSGHNDGFGDKNFRTC